MSAGPGSGADACTPGPLPLDDRASQCERLADYMAAHPGCTPLELAEAVDVGSVTKCISEMPRYGYTVRKVRESVPCVGGTRKRRGTVRYFIDGRPSRSQLDLFNPA